MPSWLLFFRVLPSIKLAKRYILVLLSCWHAVFFTVAMPCERPFSATVQHNYILTLTEPRHYCLHDSIDVAQLPICYLSRFSHVVVADRGYKTCGYCYILELVAGDMMNWPIVLMHILSPGVLITVTWSCDSMASDSTAFTLMHPKGDHRLSTPRMSHNHTADPPAGWGQIA